MAQLIASGIPQQLTTVVAALAALLAALVAVLATALWLRRTTSDQAAGDLLRSAFDGALLGLGIAAVLDNLFFHWLLQAHRFVEGWAGSIYVEAALVVAGAIVTVVGARRLRERLRRSRRA